MRKLSLFNKVVFFINLSFAFLLLLASVTPYLSHEVISGLYFLSLTFPFLMTINLFFLFYWLLQRKLFFGYSLLTLAFGYILLGTFFKLNNSQGHSLKEDLSVMTFNVRGFNKTGQIKSPGVFEDIFQLINRENPDVICFQEVDYKRVKEFEQYPYRHVKYTNNKGKSILGIFSKFPILKSENLNFENSSNDAAYADIVYQKDTIRIYNIHLESLRVPHQATGIWKEPSNQLYQRLGKSFKKQQRQATLFMDHKSKSPYKTIVCGDLNNTQFSRVYKMVKGDLRDTFIEKGSGIGRTYNFLRFPIRIDFIFGDFSFEIIAHKNFDKRLSDHYPVMASFRLKD